MKRTNFTARVYRTAKNGVRYILLTWFENGKLMIEKVLFKKDFESKPVLGGDFYLAISAIGNTTGSLALWDKEEARDVPIQYSMSGLSTKM
jgi:hypothetical protein